MNLIIVENTDSVDGGRYRLGGERAEHVFGVLKSKVGDELRVGMVDGGKGVGVVEAISKGEVVLKCEFEEKAESMQVGIDLVCALPRQQTVKKVLHSAAAMGVGRIFFIRANRVEKSYFEASVLEEDNIRRFLIEGLSQGGKTAMPVVSVHRYFKKFFEDELGDVEKNFGGYDVKLLAEFSTEKMLSEFDLGVGKRVLLAIGPEGGWVDFEVGLMEGVGFEKFFLGPWTLRVENAVVAAIGQIELAVNGYGK
ncbi:MAG: RNA methyltransferase [Planctomycetes bacterium]|nr:RNA methyltransferase [Planctomycetota bacterium]